MIRERMERNGVNSKVSNSEKYIVFQICQYCEEKIRNETSFSSLTVIKTQRNRLLSFWNLVNPEAIALQSAINKIEENNSIKANRILWQEIYFFTTITKHIQKGTVGKKVSMHLSYGPTLISSVYYLHRTHYISLIIIFL